jgi:hypothetical protein
MQEFDEPGEEEVAGRPLRMAGKEYDAVLQRETTNNRQADVM